MAENGWDGLSRVGYTGIQRVANCSGGYVCKNSTCAFMNTYQKQNKFHFKKKCDDNRATVFNCIVCGENGTKIDCECQKIWEFNDESLTVNIYHYGYHNCSAIPILPSSEHQFKKSFSNSNVSPQEAANGILFNSIDNNDVTEQELNNLIDSTLDQQRLRNLKKKCRSEQRPHGHSFEAVSYLKSTISHRDPFFIYKVNDRKMNGEISFVFKTSKFLLDLALSMDKDKQEELKVFCFKIFYP